MSRRSRHLGGYVLRNGIFVPSLIKSVQRGTITITSPATSNTATITSVAMANSRLRHLWSSVSSGGNFGQGAISLVLTNATTITATTQTDIGSTHVVSYEITEYWPGVLRSVQRNTITLGAAVTSNTATITSVNTAKSELSYLGEQSDEAQNADSFAKVVLTNATTVTATRNGGGGAAGTAIVSFEVAEFW